MNGKDYNTLIPYEVLEHKGIDYNPCRDYDHISRYKGLRQVTHHIDELQRYMTLEGPNPFTTNSQVIYYTVTTTTENRLDLIAERFLGSAYYSWVIAYFNDIEDGFSCRVGQRLRIPESFTGLFNDGELLAPVNALKLNLGSE